MKAVGKIEQCPFCLDSGDQVWIAFHGRNWFCDMFLQPSRLIIRVLLRYKIIEIRKFEDSEDRESNRDV